MPETMKINLGFLLSSALFIGACAQIPPYRTDQKPCDVDLSQASSKATGAVNIEKTRCPNAARVRILDRNPYELAYVEIDDQGFFADRKQAELALEMAGAPPADARKAGRVRVLAFIHGWHHNASVEDENVAGFHQALAALSAWNPDDTIRGIYIGWRGDSLAIPGLRYLTFWDRKNTSDEVGRGSLYEFLLRLERAVKTPSSTRNRLTLVGHSFGASVVFNSLAQLYMQRFIEGVHASDPGRKFRGYGDLVILINPAIEAMRYMPLKSATSYYAARSDGLKADFSGEAYPVLLTLSSEGDWATRTTFPFARFFSTIWETHRRASAMGSAKDEGPYSEWVMDFKAVGNYQGFNTHEVIQLKSPDLANRVQQCRGLPKTEFEELVNGKNGQPFPDSGVLLRRKSDAPDKLSPYWHAELGTEIVKDHTSIGNLNLVCWISQLLELR